MGPGTCQSSFLSERALGADNHRIVVVRFWTTRMGARRGRSSEGLGACRWRVENACPVRGSEVIPK